MWLETALLFACAFPYTQIIPLASYNQPYALILGALVFAVRGPRALAKMQPMDRWALSGLLVVGVVLFIVTTYPDPSGQDLKYILNYLTPFLIAPSIFSIAREDPKLIERVLTAAVVIWFGVAVVQLVQPTFLTGLVGSFSEASTAMAESGRGVLGLAPEPTHHGFHMLVLAACLSVVSRKRWPIILCILDALLLARSASAILALGLGGLTWCCLRPQRLVIPAALASAGLLGGIGLFKFSSTADTRVVRLIGLALEHPADLLTVDYSVNMRMGGMIASFVTSLNDGLVPHGMSHDAYMVARPLIVRQHDWLLDLSTIGFPSGFGVLIYQAGWFILPILAAFIIRLASAHRLGLQGILVVSTPFIFLGQYYLTTPGFAIIFGLVAARAAASDRRIRSAQFALMTEPMASFT